MIDKNDICKGIERARDKFLRLNRNFNTASLKGRNHVQRTAFASCVMDNLANRYAGNNLSNQLAGSFGQSYCTIWPTAFVEIVAEEIGVPIEILVNNVDV
jgi:uncharacterized protein YvpB